jgi:hypothetical protein
MAVPCLVNAYKIACKFRSITFWLLLSDAVLPDASNHRSVQARCTFSRAASHKVRTPIALTFFHDLDD